MNEFKKRYVVSEAIGRASLWRTVKMIGTFNRRKFGRNRRGMVMIERCDGFERSDGLWEITIVFSKGRSPFFRMKSWTPNGWAGRRWQMYEFTDFRKLIRPLAKHSKCPNH
jgi:hypothetical protein